MNRKYMVLATVSACLIVGSSCTTPTVPITQLDPKVYDDSQVIQLADKAAKRVDALSNSAFTTGINEFSGVRSARKFDLAVGAAPTGTTIALPAASDVALPDAPSFDPSIPAGSQLQELVRQQTDVLAYELLFQGDADAIAVDREVSLIRLDVSLNGYQKLGKDYRKFVVVSFEVEPKDSAQEDDFRLYLLAPEQSTVFARESLANATFNSLSGTLTAPILAGAGTASGNGRIQSALEEAFGSLYERPMQFAVYGESRLEANFAFGPQRKLVERSLLERWFLFKRKYAMHYEITPGPRDFYVAVIHPKGAEFVVKSGGNSTLNSSRVDGVVTDGNNYKAFPDFSPRVFTTLDLDKTPVPFPVFDKGSSAVVVDTEGEFSAIGARVFVGPNEIPRGNIDTLSRTALRVTIPGDARYGLFKDGALKLRVVDRTGRSFKDFDCKFHKVGKTVTAPPITASPTLVRKGETITFTSNSDAVDLNKLNEATFSNTFRVPADDMVFEPARPKAKAVKITLPNVGAASGVKIPVSLTFDGQPKPITVTLEAR